VTFEEYVAQRGQSLLRFAYVLTGDSHLAEDLTQTALADAYRHWRKVERAGNRDAYVRRILVNAHLSWRRRRSSTGRPAEAIAQTAIAVTARDQTRWLLNGLAPKARTVLVLRYYADLDDTAIAELMGIRPSTVRATASRALAALRNDGVLDAMEESQ
jgi:RNA polymerase sigma-70 factor (sigma-E family)